MIRNFEWMIALRYLKPRRKEGVVSIIAAFSFLGIMLGVATLIIVMAVMNGFREELMNKILGFNGHIGIYTQHYSLSDDMIARCRQFPAVKTVNPFMEQQGLTLKGSAMAGVQMRAVDFNYLEHHSPLAGKINSKSAGGDSPSSLSLLQENLADKDSALPPIILGCRLAHKMNVDVGQKINILLPQGRSTAFGRLPKTKKFRIAGIFTAGMVSYDEAFVFIPLQAGQEFFTQKSVNLEIFLDSPTAIEGVLPSIKNLLKDTAGVQVVDWQTSNAHFFNAIKIERNVMFLILTLIIIVAAFNIISSMIMVVKDKTTNIAILRTMGASKKSILTIFFLTGSLIGCIGTLAGVGLGLGIAYHIEEIRQWLEGLSHSNLFSAEVYFLSQLPAIVKIEDVVLVAGMALALSFLATFYPSWRAATVDPAETLRYG